MFRVTRNADLTVEDEEADDLLAAVEMELRRRRFGGAVRLEVQDTMSAEMLELLVRELELDDADVSRHRGLIDLTCLWQLHGARPPRAEGPAVAAGHRRAGRHGRGGRPQLLLGRARAGADRAPPVRELRQQRRAVHRRGRRRPAGAVDQDDDVPRRRRQPDRAQPDPRRRARRAGGRARRAQGPLRRGDQRRLGQGAGARRRARRLRRRRAEDPRQVRARRAQRRRRPAPLLPHRHRQLQLEDGHGCTRTSGSSPATRRSAPTSPSCSTTSPATAGRTTTSRCSSRPRDMRNQLLDLDRARVDVRRRRAHLRQAQLARPTPRWSRRCTAPARPGPGSTC